MAFWKRKSRNKKKYSPLEKMKYHTSRKFSPKSNGIKYESRAHFYSDGFYEGWYGNDNRGFMKNNYGASKGNSYALGYENGQKAARNYRKTTGKDPGDVRGL